MASFDRAVLIFNPNSTGDAQLKAEELRDELSERLPELLVELVPTQHAGHARELARDAASTGRPLIISVSGDGGYNEVVDGAMRSGNASAVCAVLAAGNANDHRRTTRERPLADAIIGGKISRLDMLQLTIDGESSYAHSYIGLGLTPAVAVDLEKSGKGSLRELVTTIRAFAQFRPFEIEHPDRTRERFDSIIFANIHQMAKVATLSEDGGRPDDGAFEVITMRHTAKWKLLGTALRAGTRGLGPQPSATEYAFTTVKAMPIQIDGEVLDLDAGAQVRIDIAPKALRTVL
jgi:diacylglycerol kinase family enzyme